MSHHRFDRDRVTWLCYGTLGTYTFWLYGFGPALALLRAEQHFRYSLIGVYSALWAAGAAVSGVGFAGLSRRIGRTNLLWTASLATCAGAAMFAVGTRAAPTLCAAFVMGAAGTTVQLGTQSALSDRHGPGRDQALAESNVAAGVCAVVSPLLIGLLADTPVGWRTGMVLPMVAVGGLYLYYRRERLPPPPPHHDDTTGRFPPEYWMFAALTVTGMALEFCLVYFGAEFLAHTGLRPSAAAAVMSGFYLGILAGRVVGARLTRRPGRAVRLIWASLAVTAVGFGVFWLADRPVPAAVGLFVCGVGIANLFPLSLALTLATAPGRTDAANARTEVLGGVVVIVAPLVLGTLADHLGLMRAFGVEPVFIVVCCVLLVAGVRANRERW